MGITIYPFYGGGGGSGDLATVAVTGAYSDLTGRPTLGTAATTDATDYATAAQGTAADTALQPGAAVSQMTETAAAKILTASERTRIALALVSDVAGIAGAEAVTNLVSLTQAEYDAIGTPSATTLYVITD